MPCAARISRIRPTKCGLVTRLPLWSRKNAPAVVPLTSRYSTIALTGQTHNNVRASAKLVIRKTFQVNLHHARRYPIIYCDVRSVTGLYEAAVEGRSSPRQKNPKNAAQEMAHNTTLSGSLLETKVSWIFSNTRIVMGSRSFGGARCLCSLSRLIPAWTRRRSGRDDCSLGSGSPREICALRSADR